MGGTNWPLAAASVALVLSGCGGKAAPTPAENAASAAKAHWRAGLTSWSHGMNAAVDRLSIIFSSPADVRGIQTGGRAIGVKLATIEGTLFDCTARVTALGAAPVGLMPARAEALVACKQLERGAMLVRAGVQQLQGGQGVALFDRASDPLGAGQDDVRRAMLDLAAPAG